MKSLNGKVGEADAGPSCGHDGLETAPFQDCGACVPSRTDGALAVALGKDAVHSSHCSGHEHLRQRDLASSPCVPDCRAHRARV